MHEIVTIQLGHRANHVATHFWNTQVFSLLLVAHAFSAASNLHIAFPLGRNLTLHMMTLKHPHLLTMTYIFVLVSEQEERRHIRQGLSSTISREALEV